MAELALFDFDGTLTTGETFPAFVRSVVPEARQRAARLRLAPLVLAYRLGLASGSQVRAAVVYRGLAGMDAAAFEAAAEDWSRRELPGWIRPQALQRLRTHRERGDTVLVVSGNFEVLLRPWAEAEGVQVAGSRLEVRQGRLTGHYAGPQCVLAEKVARVRERVDPSGFARIHAYGDTPEDRPMLLLADVAHYLPRGWPTSLTPDRID